MIKGILTCAFTLILLFNISHAQVLEQDSLILVKLFNTTNGTSWTNKTNWLSGPVPTWYGITAAGNRVTQINLSANFLFGTLPKELKDLNQIEKIFLQSNGLTGSVPDFSSNSHLIEVNVSSNQLSSLPDLSASSIQKLDVSNNSLSFGDLEKNIQLAEFKYSSQYLEVTRKYVTKRVGESLSLLVNASGQNNLYQWKKSNSEISGATSNTLSIASLKVDDAGIYSVDVSNSLLPGLTITYNDFAIIYVLTENFFVWVEDAFPNDNPQATSYGGFWADIDNDGDEDVFINNFTDTVRNYLYINKGNGTFSKLETGNIVKDFKESRSVSWGEINNDGYPDLFVGAYPEFVMGSDEKASVYINNKDLTFTKIDIETKASGGVWGDIDNDGFLDLAVNHEGQTTRFFMNNKMGAFTPSAFLDLGTTWFTTFLDFDNDLDPDFFQAFSALDPIIQLYRNDQETGFFPTSALETPSLTSRGGSWADFNNDGYLDYLALNQVIGFGDSFFFINNKNGSFSKKKFSEAAGETLQFSRASTVGDFDNDGIQDIFVIGTPGSGLNGCYLYKGEANVSFKRLTNAEQVFAGTNSFSQLSLADYNNDGFLDLFESSQDTETSNHLFKNKGNNNGWIKLKLIGDKSNRLGIGSRVRIKTNAGWQTRQILSQSGLASQNSMIAHFGIASASKIDSIRVYWPSGNISELKDVERNQLLKIYESPSEPESVIIGLKSEELNYEVYPNPFDKFIKIEFPVTEQAIVISLIDIYGKKVFESNPIYGIDSFSISADQFAKGFYVLNLETTAGVKHFKLLKK